MTFDSKRIVIALDYADASSARILLKELDPSACRVKIGKELFTRCGPAFVEEVIAQGFDVFLDLKYHDIPNTVAKAVLAAAEIGVWMVNFHASGGRAMMEAASSALVASAHRPLLIAVTVLTSMSHADLKEVGVDASPESQVLRLASLARDCGIDGVVCSAQETSMLASSLGREFALVTPGIRPAGDTGDDQKRIMTPGEAIRAGSHFLVIGRPITQHPRPNDKIQEIVKEISGGFGDLC